MTISSSMMYSVLRFLQIVRKQASLSGGEAFTAVPTAVTKTAAGPTESHKIQKNKITS